MKSMTDIAWFRTPMRTELLLTKIKQTPSLLNIVKAKKDITTQMNQEINFRLNGSINNFITLFILAEQGNWKSSLGQAIATEWDKIFTSHQIFFSYEDFEEKFKTSLPKTFNVLDEQCFIHGMGTSRIVHDMQTKIETLRKRQNSIIIISPEIKHFNENLFTFILEPFDNSITATCPYNKKPHEPRTCKCDFENNYTVIEAYCRTAVKKEGQYIGFYIVPIEWNNKIWQEYSIRKDEFNEKVAQQQHNKTNYEEMADKMLKDPDAYQYKTKKALSILCHKYFPTLTVQENATVTEHASMKRKISEANEREDVNL